MTIKSLADSEGVSKQAVWKIIDKLEMRDELMRDGSGAIILSDDQADRIREYRRQHGVKRATSSGEESRQTISDLREDRDNADQVITDLIEELDEKDREIQALTNALVSMVKSLNGAVAALNAMVDRESGK